MPLLVAGLAVGCTDPKSGVERTRSRTVPPAERVEPALPWDVRSIDLSEDGRVWALGNGALYRWSAGESGWTMVQALEVHGRFPRLFVAPDGFSAVIATTTNAARWRDGDGELTSLPIPDGFELWDARGELWFAVRNEIEPDVLARLGPHTSAGYPADGRGWWSELACSAERGASWSVIDRIDGAHCVRLDEQSGGALTMLLGSLGVRAGTVEVDATGEIVADLDTIVRPRRLPLPGDTFLGEWILMDGSAGRIGLSAHHGSDGAVSYETRDGWLTWSAVEEPHCLSVTGLRLGDGRVLRLRESLDEVEWSLERWTGGGFERLTVPDGADHVRIAHGDVDAAGALLLLLESGALWSLPPGSNEWQLVWDSLPGRARVPRY